LATLPAVWLSRRLGRRGAYQYGAGVGLLAGVLAAYAIQQASFALFMLATAMCGIYQAFVVSYRFGAADHASPAFRPTAIAWVLAGGVAAAFVGPQLVIHTKDLMPPFVFSASYLGQAAFAGISIFALMLFRNAPPALPGADDRPARTLGEILQSRRLKLAIGISAIAQALMNFLMTAAPLAMIGCLHTTTDATLAIQWHIVGMLLPGFSPATSFRNSASIVSLPSGYCCWPCAVLWRSLESPSPISTPRSFCWAWGGISPSSVLPLW
jgi:hypothetical protein